MRKLVLLTLVIALLAGATAYAKDNSQTAGSPEKYVLIHHASVKHGGNAAFNNMVRQFKNAALSTRADFYWVAGYNITGPENQVEFVSFFDSLDALDRGIETIDKIGETAMKTASFRNDAATATESGAPDIIGKYREDLSYNPTAVDLAHTTRWRVFTLNIRPGYMSDSEKMIKQDIELRRKTSNGDHWVAYEVVAGMQGNTIFLVTPVKSLADLEIDYDEAVMKAMTPEARQEFSTWVRTAVTSFETNFVGVSPEWSRPPQSVVAANPDFWNRQNAPMAASGSQPRGKKAGEVSPAAMKSETKK